MPSQKKTSGLLNEFDRILEACPGAFGQERSEARARTLMLSSLVCLGRHTITGMVCASGRQFRDWSADYRVFSEARVDAEAILDGVRRGVTESLAPGAPLVAGMDDSILRKRGRRIPGTQYHRDPLGPPFHVNLAWGQRGVQISAAMPPERGDAPARMTPIDFQDAPRPPKPGRDAPDEAWPAYRAACRAASVSRVGAGRVRALRARMDADDPSRPLWMTVDGRFTNATVLKSLPERVALIGRVRRDAKLYHLPDASPIGPGRRRSYGDLAPTPEQVLRDETVPWQTARVYAAGRVHDLRYKTLAPLRWRPAGAHRDLRLIVIAPLAYRPRKGSKLLYRKPAFLICTDPDLPIEAVLQAYVWRWDIEVNFRDEKTLLGVGEPQVRSALSVPAAPALQVAGYAVLLLAASRAFGVNGRPDGLPQPKWRNPHEPPRAATADLIQHLRAELWGQALGVADFSGFTTAASVAVNPPKSAPDLASAVLYARS